MQFGPYLFAGFPDHFAETAAGVLQRHDKQARTAVCVCAGFAGKRTKTVVHLGLLSGRKLKPSYWVGFFLRSARQNRFTLLYLCSKANRSNQILINGYGIASQTNLLLYPGAVLLTG